MGEKMSLQDTFRGDDAKLIGCIEALVSMSDAGALVPHGIGGHARTLLSAAAVRLSAHLTQPAQAVDVPKELGSEFGEGQNQRYFRKGWNACRQAMITAALPKKPSSP